MKTLQIYLADLKELLGSRDFVLARTLLKEIGPIDLADGWDNFDADERVAIFRLSTRQKAMQLFEELESHQHVDGSNVVNAAADLIEVDVAFQVKAEKTFCPGEPIFAWLRVVAFAKNDFA